VVEEVGETDSRTDCKIHRGNSSNVQKLPPTFETCVLIRGVTFNVRKQTNKPTFEGF